jgi:hypothetical protein
VKRRMGITIMPRFTVTLTVLEEYGFRENLRLDDALHSSRDGENFKARTSLSIW